VALRIGSRQFAPSLFGTLAMLAVLGVLLSLGRWQLHRADDKRALYEAFESGAGSTLPADTPGAPLVRYQHVSAAGHYDPSEQILVDNMPGPDGRAGYYVITPFKTSSGPWLLINRGWVPMGNDRAVLPAVPAPADERRIAGRVDHLPQPGIHMGTPAPLKPPFPVRATYPSPDTIRALLGGRDWSQRAEVILLDAREPDGFVRQWSAPGFPPMRHVAYAVQWFGLAAALVVLYVVSSLKS
jgi:surfeit locus 1 family protein